MKNYTDIGQSKKLAEILPIESADMCYSNSPVTDIINTDNYTANLHTVKEMKEVFDKRFHQWDTYWKLIPCWSLAALLDVIPGGQVNRMANSDKWEASSWNDTDFEPTYHVEDHDNAVDACYELILKLHELKLL